MPILQYYLLTNKGFQLINMSPVSPLTKRACHIPRVTLKKACELTGKSKHTIQRYMANGKLSYKTNKLGYKKKRL